MKILTGRLRGRALGTFSANPALRPTADKVRKAIMDTLAAEIQGKRVLDLFSGTGALGFEMLSSGAVWVTFVEKHTRQAREIQKNLHTLNLSASARVIPMDFRAAIDRLNQDGEKFGIVLLDPPYEKGLGDKALEALRRSGLLSPDTWVVLECFKKEVIGDSFKPYKLVREKIYGDTKILFYYNPSS